MPTNPSDDDSERPRRSGGPRRGDDGPRRPRRETGERRDTRQGPGERPRRPRRENDDRRRDERPRGDRGGNDRDRSRDRNDRDRDRGRAGDRDRGGHRGGGPRRDSRRDDRRDQRGSGSAPRGSAPRGGPRDRRDDRRDDRRGGPRDRRDDRRDDRRGGPRDARRNDRESVRRLPIPDDVTGDEVPKEVRQELRSLPKTLAEDVARNLVMAGRLLEEDPEQAYAYSRVALRLASRVPAVREAAGFASYGIGKYAEALAEFRAARRMTGGVHLWPLMADCERGMGRPERALAMAGEPEVQRLDKAGQVEMRLVAAGARRDMGQAEAAVVTLQSSELASSSVQPWSARLRYAYADVLLEVGRTDEAREWFAKALEADQSGVTDASDRLAELDGVEFLDALDEDADDPDAEGQDADDPDTGDSAETGPEDKG